VYAPALFGVALRIAEAEEKAAHIVAETFRRTWRNAANFDPAKDQFFPWALSLLKSVAGESRRASGEQPLEKFNFASYQAKHPADGEAVPMSLLEQQMDEKHRKVIELAYFHGLSEQEIEAEMNIPVGTVNTRLRFSLRELRKVLNDKSR
jgi:RNA polymerase sigma-70 factor (ECF subfamily)